MQGEGEGFKARTNKNMIETHENINKNVMLSRLGILIRYHDRVKAEADDARSPGMLRFVSLF